MGHANWNLRSLAILILFLCIASFATAQTPATEQPSQSATSTTADTLKMLDELAQHNQQLEEQNKELMKQIAALRRVLEAQAGSNSQAPAAPESNTSSNQPQQSEANSQTTEKPNPPAVAVVQETPKTWGTYTPNFGFKLANTQYGDINLSIFTYVRYLNQRSLDSTYTDAFGNTSTLQQRQDVQLNKVQIKFFGWVLNPKLRYFLYAWTNNAAAGQSGYLYLAGNVNYKFNDYFTLYGGVNGLPAVRSLEGNFPYWLSVDSRLIADEFFRPSYTMGIWGRGQIAKGLTYHAMIGNNLSTIGVNASQLNNHFDTFSGALIWNPTTGEYGPAQGFGDFEDHKKFATRLAVHFTRSDENKQSQPNSETFENTQLRLSDGSIIFKPDLFSPGVSVTDARYRMASADGGFKFHGYELWAEGYWRWLDNFKGPGTSIIPNQLDTGFQAQASAMLVPKTYQAYIGGSWIFGNYGDPYDFRIGTNWFPFKNRVFRLNTEGLFVYHSPVGYTAVPYPLGGKGWIFHTAMELAF